MTAAEVLSLVERAFPFVTRPAAADLPAHPGGCCHCEMTAHYLANHPGPGLPARAIRWLCDEMSTLSPAATAWVLPSYLRYVLTEENPRNPRPTEYLIYDLAPRPEHTADVRTRLSLLSGGQVEALRTVIRHLADTPYWADYCGDELGRAATFLQGLPGDPPDAPDAERGAASDRRATTGLHDVSSTDAPPAGERGRLPGGLGMDERRRLLLAHIDWAFAGVELGDGVSLHESHVIDNYGSAEERRAAREADEKRDWRKLVDHPDLTVYFGIGYSGLCFLDAAGVRFHLPACLYRVVRDFDDDGIGNMYESLYYLLTNLDEYIIDRLAILSGDQRACVRECLVWYRDLLESDAAGLVRAIDGYWSLPAGT